MFDLSPASSLDRVLLLISELLGSCFLFVVAYDVLLLVLPIDLLIYS
jgi:hypothetical protein